MHKIKAFIYVVLLVLAMYSVNLLITLIPLQTIVRHWCHSFLVSYACFGFLTVLTICFVSFIAGLFFDINLKIIVMSAVVFVFYDSFSSIIFWLRHCVCKSLITRYLGCFY